MHLFFLSLSFEKKFLSKKAFTFKNITTNIKLVIFLLLLNFCREKEMEYQEFCIYRRFIVTFCPLASYCWMVDAGFKANYTHIFVYRTKDDSVDRLTTKITTASATAAATTMIPHEHSFRCTSHTLIHPYEWMNWMIKHAISLECSVLNVHLRMSFSALFIPAVFRSWRK